MKNTHLIAITITGAGLLIASMFKNSLLQILGGLLILFGLVFSVYNDIKKEEIKAVKPIILDNNEISSENWKKICSAVEEKTNAKHN